uniref:BFN domain-containing protein n=6 Tax=Gossypium TaxID=3633 RepID=A0A0D2RJ37_GOSRA|nr:hypothetical protein B456_005G109300 [Gossypium raimondii]
MKNKNILSYGFCHLSFSHLIPILSVICFTLRALFSSLISFFSLLLFAPPSPLHFDLQKRKEPFKFRRFSIYSKILVILDKLAVIAYQNRYLILDLYSCCACFGNLFWCGERGKMVSLQGPVICPAVRSKQFGVYMPPANGPFPRAKLYRSDIWGYRGITDGKNKARAIFRQLKLRKCRTTVQCSFSSSSDGNGSMAENFNENDEDYVNSSVLEAVEVRSGADGFMIKMRDGRHLRCVHNNPQGGHLPDYAPHPAIVLKMEDGTGLLLPIIVLEMPSVLLMAAVRNVQIARPTMYQVVKDMIDKMGYTVKLVRVTKRVHEAYFAQLYLTKVGDESKSVIFDLRPSDAINIAVRCKVSIQVNKYLAYSDGMRVIESGKLSMQSPASNGILFTELDRPSGQHCLDTEEFNMVCKLNEAINQERYKDAADLRDKLRKFRAQRKLRKYT